MKALGVWITMALIALASAAATGCGIGEAQTRLRTAVDAKQQELGQCYGEALARNPQAGGTIQAWINLDSDSGRIESVEYTGGDFRDEAMLSCMTSTLQTVQLMQAPKANLRVEYAFHLTPN